MVDAGFTYIQALNTSDRTQIIKKKDRIGQLLEPDYTSAYQVTAEAATLCTLGRPPLLRPPLIQTDHTDIVYVYTANPDPSPATLSTKPAGPMETVLPNGIIIYGTPDVVERFRAVYEAYDIWFELRLENTEGF